MSDLDLACCGFLSLGRILLIERYPPADSGAPVSEIIETVTPDAPIVAGLSGRLGVAVGLLSNELGEDSAGDFVESLLAGVGVQGLRRERLAASRTPQTVVVSDQFDTRTWFSWLPKIDGSLAAVKLESLDKAKLCYVDVYHIIEPFSQSAIREASQHNVPLVANLGGDYPTAATIALLRAANVMYLQTSLSAANVTMAKELVQQLFDEIRPDVAIVTMSTAGCVYLLKNRVQHFPAYRIQPMHHHGAGAAFSAGLLYSASKGYDINRTIAFASALGGLYLTKRQGITEIAVGDIEALMTAS
jgi:sugar/nucleoside kinase (ribokinase family)